MIQLEPVESSMVAAMGYDAGLKALVILFNSGKAYQFLEVPPEIFQGLTEARSKGRYLMDHVIDFYPSALFKGWKYLQQ